jgi:hypothetical protein
MEYFLLRQGTVYGPYSIAQMRIFVSEGRVRLTDYARTGTAPQWQPLHFIWDQPAAVPAPWTAPAPPPPPPGPPRVQQVAVSAPGDGLIRGNVLSWPFHQRAWFESLWMTLLWWVPLLGAGVFLNIGWSIEAARKRSGRAPDLLPRAERFGRMLLDGLIVSFFFCAYILIPVTLAWMITSLENLDFIIPAIEWVWHVLRGQVAGNFIDIMTGVVIEHIKHRAMIILYLLLSWPVFTAAGIRFVLTRKASSFFHLPACLGILFRNFGAILQFLLLAGMTAVAITVADAFAASTVIAAPLMILVGAAGIWILTYLYGNLALKVQPSLQPEINAALAVRAGAVQGPVQ